VVFSCDFYKARKDREGYLRLIFSIEHTNTVWSQYRESVDHSPTLKEFAFRLINGVVRVREFAYYEYGY
jgi:hypothetical protein